MNELQLFLDVVEGIMCFAFLGSLVWLMTIEV
jgi:hypothetical protein